MRLGPTQRPPERNARVRVSVALVALVSLVFSGCAAAGVIRATPDTSPTAGLAPTTVRPTPRPPASPVADDNLPRIERVTLASAVEQDGTPKDEGSVFPEHPTRVFLCVKASAVKANTSFRAVWFENGRIIGQSDATAPSDSPTATWVALGYSPVFALNPHVDHTVELVVNQTSIGRYAFRVGVGNAKQVIAEATLAVSTDASSSPVGAASEFYVTVQQMVLWARVSNEVDPSSMSFATTWYRGDTQVAQIGPDGGQPSLPPTPTPASRRMTFTWLTPSGLTPGGYHVDLYLNGQLVASYPFNISVVPPATPTPQATPTHAPTAAPNTPTPVPTLPPTVAPTPAVHAAAVDDLVITTVVDPDSHAPTGARLVTLEGEAQSLVKPWFAIEVSNLSKSDTLEIVVTLNGGEYGTRKLKATNIAAGWIAANIALDTPRAGEQPYTYGVSVLLNGQRTLDTTLVVSVANTP